MRVFPPLLASAAIVLSMLGLSAWAWGQLPEGASMPVHWGVSGEPDRYGGKVEGLLALPLVMLGISVLFAVIPRFEPRREHLEQSAGAYVAVWLAILLVMAAIHAGVVLTAVGYPVDMGVLVSVAIGLLFMVIGGVMGRIRSNYFFGVRTPWTLTSELSWEKTHRLTGRLFVLLGVVLVLVSLTGNGPLLMAVLLGGVAVVLLTVVVYSYQVWKADPNKQAAGR